jgi:hypothetical protein
MPLCLIKHYVMKAYEEVNVQIHMVMNSALFGGKSLASRPGRFTSGGRAPVTHWTGGWVGSRAGLDAVK